MKAEFCTGVGACPIADVTNPTGSVTASFRTRLAIVCGEDGLLQEMEQKLPAGKRMPWRDRESHAWAIRQLERGPYPGMSEEEQRAALEYVRGTPFYEW